MGLDAVEVAERGLVGLAIAADVEEDGVRVRAGEVPVDEPVVGVPAVFADELVDGVDGVPAVPERHAQVLHGGRFSRRELK